MENIIIVPKKELSTLIEEVLRKVLTEQVKSEPKETLMSIDEAAQFLNVSKSTIYTWTSTKKIPYIKCGKRLYFKEQDLLAWLEKGKQKTKEELDHIQKTYYSKKVS